MKTFRPLEGIRIVDVSHVIAGPFATFQLAQMGAEVLKIEHINGGDVMRRSAKGPRAFAALNAGKKKIRLDIDATADRERIIMLARNADVFVDNLRPGVLETKGLGYEALKAVNPRIIYCSISGFGRSGGTRRADRVQAEEATGVHMQCVQLEPTILGAVARSHPLQVLADHAQDLIRGRRIQ